MVYKILDKITKTASLQEASQTDRKSIQIPKKIYITRKTTTLANLD